MARERPTASDVQQTLAEIDRAIVGVAGRARGAPDDDGGVLSHAQMRALRRCAPLTGAEFKEHRQLAQKRELSLSRVRDADVDDGALQQPSPPASA